MRRVCISDVSLNDDDDRFVLFLRRMSTRIHCKLMLMTTASARNTVGDMNAGSVKN